MHPQKHRTSYACLPKSKYRASQIPVPGTALSFYRSRVLEQRGENNLSSGVRVLEYLVRCLDCVIEAMAQYYD